MSPNIPFLNQSSLFLFNDDINGSSTIDPGYGCLWTREFRERESALIKRWKEGGIFVDEDFKDINCYWLQFDPAPLAHHLILALIFFIISAIGCTCNALVVYLLATSRHLRSPANILIMNLAASDFLMLIKMPVFIYNSIAQGPSLGYTGCKVYGFLSGLAGCSSIMSLAAVAAERCWVISRPLPKATVSQQSGNGLRNCRWVYWLILVIWIYAATFSALPFFGIGKYVPEGYLTSCSFDYLSDDPTTHSFVIIIFICFWVVPITIIIVSYVLIVRYVRRAMRDMPVRRHSQHQDNDGFDSEDQLHQRQRTKWLKCLFFELPTAKITLGLVVLWVLSWTPYAIIALIGISGHQRRLTPNGNRDCNLAMRKRPRDSTKTNKTQFMTMLPALFAKTSACVNPFVYSLTHPKMKKEMLRRYHRWALKGTNGSDVSIRPPSGRADRRNMEEPYEDNYVSNVDINRSLDIDHDLENDIPMLPIDHSIMFSSSPPAARSMVAETMLGQLTSENDSSTQFGCSIKNKKERDLFSETDADNWRSPRPNYGRKNKNPAALMVTFQDSSSNRREGIGKFKVQSVLASSSPSQQDGKKDRHHRWCRSSIKTSSSPNSDLKVDISFRSGTTRRSSIDEGEPVTTEATVHYSTHHVADDEDDNRYKGIPFFDDSINTDQ